MINSASLTKQSKPSVRLNAATHLFALGQAVRLIGGMRASDNVFLITAKLPPIGDSPQYRIRNEAEKFERMATQASLELVNPSTDGESAASIGTSPRLGLAT